MLHKSYTSPQTELSLAVDDADLFSLDVGEDILNVMTMYEVLVSTSIVTISFVPICFLTHKLMVSVFVKLCRNSIRIPFMNPDLLNASKLGCFSHNLMAV